MNTFLFFHYGIRMLYFFFFQIRPILYSSKPIRLQIFFPVSDKTNYLKMLFPRIQYSSSDKILTKKSNKH